MDTAQHATPRCPVYLHPACASKPATVLSIQQATGQLVVINGGKARLLQSQPLFHLTTGEMDYLPAHVANRRFFILDESDTGPFGGDAA